jgi:hypothetical protein
MSAVIDFNEKKGAEERLSMVYYLLLIKYLGKGDFYYLLRIGKVY